MSGRLDRLRARLEPVPGRTRAHPLRNGVITLGLLFGALALVLAVSLVPRGTSLFGDGDGAVVRAEFRHTADLKVGDVVRVHGVDAGKVTKLELTDARTSLVTMRLDDERNAPRRDARANIYWRIILGGNDYVELDLGSPSAPELGDRPIPARRTSSQSQFDDLFQPYDARTRRFQRTIFDELRSGLGDPRAGGRAIDTLAPTLSTVERGLAPMRGRRSDDLRRLVASSARVLRALGSDGGRLAALVEHGETTFGVTAAHRRPLGQAIELSPAAMDASVAALEHTVRTLDRLDPLAARLRPAARALAPTMRVSRPALRELDAFLRESRPLLRAAAPTFESLERAGRDGVPLLARLEPTLRRLHTELLPWLRERDPDARLATYQLIGPTASAISSAASQFDRNGTYVRFPVFADERSVGASPCQPFLTDPSADEKLRCEALRRVIPLP